MTKQFTVILDLDSTVYDLPTPTLAWVNKYNDLNLTPQDIKTWLWFLDLKRSPVEFWSQPGTFINLKPIPGVIEAIKAVHEMGVEQLFCSAIVSPTAGWEKFEAIDRDFPFIGREKTFLVGSGKKFAGAKNLLAGDVLVDDAPHYLDSFTKTGRRTILADLFGSPYCQIGAAPTEIMTNWNQYVSIIQDMMNTGWSENIG